jgi:hypothetical protein
LETTFHQDLNSDGVIGVLSPVSPATFTTSGAIVSDGSFLFRGDLGSETTFGEKPVNLADLFSTHAAPWARLFAEYTASTEPHSAVEGRDGVANDVDQNVTVQLDTHIGDLAALLTGHFIIH